MAVRYAIAAILMAYAVICLIWPGHVFRALQGNMAKTASEGYARGSAIAIRMLGLAVLIVVPALFLSGYVQ